MIAVAAEISALEGQLGIKPRIDSATNPDGPQLIPPPAGERAQGTGNTARPVSHFVSMPLPAAVTDNAAADFTAQINAAFDAVSRSSRDRQVAEHRLNDRMQELSAQATAAQWSAGHAAVVTRLGGTPRSSVLALGALLATVATVLTFRAAGCSANEAKIETTSQLASAMKLPLIGNVSMLRPGRRPSWRLLTPQRVQAVVWGCEALVAIAVLACLVSIAAEPALAHQVLADPFGTLSEVMGRFL